MADVRSSGLNVSLEETTTPPTGSEIGVRESILLILSEALTSISASAAPPSDMISVSATVPPIGSDYGMMFSKSSV